MPLARALLSVVVLFTFTFTVSATNVGGTTSTSSITITVTAAPTTFTGDTPPTSGVAGTPYAGYTFTGRG